jgi:NAD(P)-dependent dehydrogenase (short-subunit alcohol dehydrogenase family)
MGMYDFTGKTMVVTGGTGILGGEIGCALAGCRANIVFLDRNLEPGQGLLERVVNMPGRFAVLYGDVLDHAIPAPRRPPPRCTLRRPRSAIAALKGPPEITAQSFQLR